jgi:hypothetical protein
MEVEMTDHPMLFSAPMVRALLEGRKTQTRRLLTMRNTRFNGGAWPSWAKSDVMEWSNAWVDPGPSLMGNPGPYLKLRYLGPVADWFETVHRLYPVIQPGDKVWVREAWSGPYEFQHIPPSQRHSVATPNGPILIDDVWYWADGEIKEGDYERPRPSIHMPRWASRLTLLVDAIKIERLQDISEQDAFAEGIDRLVYPQRGDWEWPQRRFAELWGSINGTQSWDANPWVIALKFRVERNS